MTRTLNARSDGRKTTPAAHRTKLRSEFVRVTPDQAATWLAASQRYAEKHDVRINRRPSQGVIDRYARDMTNDHWDETGVPIIIDEHGVVRDGQQRLAAVIQSGITIGFLVVHGVKPEAQRNIDRGRRRTNADDLFIAQIPDPLNVAATASLLVAWRSGNVAITGYSPTSSEVNEFVLAHSDALVDAVRVSRRVRNNVPSLTVSVISSLSFTATEVDPKASQFFFERLFDGAELTAGNPILTLRNRIMRYSTLPRKPHRHHQLYEAVRAWNAWRANETLQLLKVPVKLTADTFPVAR